MTKNDYIKLFGKQLEKWLTKKGLTAYKLGKKAGIYNSNIYAYIEGVTTPAAPHMAKILTVLEITPAEFWGL